MKNTKSVLLILLLLTMIFVTACGGGSSNGKANNETPPASSNGNNNDGAKEEPIDEEPAINMNGEPIKIIHWMPAPSEDTAEGALILERWKEIGEKYNTEIVWEQVPWGESINMLTNAALSGEVVADFVPLDLYFAIPAVNNGLLMPVDDFFDFDDSKWPDGIKDYGKINGKMYGFLSLNNYASGLYYNKTMFKNEGVPDPHDLVAKGEWTWEAFLDIAKKLTKDTDGDGVIDQYGITNHAPTLMRILVHANGGKLIEEKDGRFVFGNENPKTVEALEFLYNLFHQDKVIAPNNRETDYADSQTLFSTGKAGMVTGETWEGSQRTNMTDEQGFVFFPKGPQATEYQGSVTNFVAYYMPLNVERAAEKAKIWEEIQLWDRVENILRESAEEQLLADEKDIEAMMEVVKFSEPVFLSLNGYDGGDRKSVV